MYISGGKYNSVCVCVCVFVFGMGDDNWAPLFSYLAKWSFKGGEAIKVVTVDT